MRFVYYDDISRCYAYDMLESVDGNIIRISTDDCKLSFSNLSTIVKYPTLQGLT